jgi:Bacterial SH3 domain
MRSEFQKKLLFAAVVFLFGSFGVSAQQAATNHKVILRQDPTTTSAPLEHLVEGVRLTLVDASPTNGFYHVKTEDDQIGWVFAKFVSLTPPTVPPPESPSTAAGCDPSIATHVYHPNRLIVKQDCVAVEGTIVDATAPQKTHHSDGVRHEKDGDTHGWLKVDSGFEGLLNAGNKSDEGGNLVFEIVCRFPVSQADAKAACEGYADAVVLPPVGSHVRILGRYVQDTFHAKWMEIHPVTSITVIP